MDISDSLQTASQAVWYITGAISLSVVILLLIKVKTRINPRFFLNIVLYALAFIIRDISYYLGSRISSDI